MLTVFNEKWSNCILEKIMYTCSDEGLMLEMLALKLLQRPIFMLHLFGFFSGLQPLLALLDSEYAIIQQLALECLIQITLDGNDLWPSYSCNKS